ncbi:shikimate kinase [Phycicoccus sp. Root101]|uniref:shikimate kinase n=1 Tax=Phycicoccus sp. Root101 TaxID=1736421 RepID=UPI000702CAEE|nr:shikimate kinase [Phycicoccus sp. Root101]KQU68993.1 shikimate kinase [Phycicoccus sp. Root101]
MTSSHDEGATARPVAVVIGPPGAGKSTIGRRLAAALGVRWHDTDSAIEEAQGASISDLFVDHGEDHFRALERAEVARALREGDVVVSLGGGAPMDAQTQELLVGHTVVFLDVGIADASRRIGFEGNRPLLMVNPRATWTKMMNERRATYERLSTVRVDTAGRKPAEIVAEVVAALGHTPAGAAPAPATPPTDPEEQS